MSSFVEFSVCVYVTFCVALDSFGYFYGLCDSIAQLARVHCRSLVLSHCYEVASDSSIARRFEGTSFCLFLTRYGLFTHFTFLLYVFVGQCSCHWSLVYKTSLLRSALCRYSFCAPLWSLLSWDSDCAAIGLACGTDRYESVG